MKTIIVPTDFSACAESAARYSIHLAKAMKSDITLVNACTTVLETAIDGQQVWPVYEDDDINENIIKDLKALTVRLVQYGKMEAVQGHPQINFVCQAGSAAEVVPDVAEGKRAELVVMGMSGLSDLARFFLGSTSREMIDNANFPLMLIPRHYNYRNIRKIAFATDLSTGDLNAIQSLAGFARYFNAEILLAHVTEDWADQRSIDSFLNKVTCTINYDKIYYRQIKSIDVAHGLNWLAEHGQIDVLTMVHERHKFLGKLFNHSYTRNMVKHINLPLLVFPKPSADTRYPSF